MKSEFTGVETPFEKWNTSVSYLNQLADIPEQMRQQLLTQVFETAEITRFTPEQVLSYEGSLKYYRDAQNTLDTAREEVREAIAREMMTAAMPVETIAAMTGLTQLQIELLK